MQHMDNCMELADENRSDGRAQAIAITYDEVARKVWAEKSRAGVPGFDVNEESLRIDRELVHKATSVLADRAKSQLKDKTDKSRNDKGVSNNSGNHNSHSSNGSSNSHGRNFGTVGFAPPRLWALNKENQTFGGILAESFNGWLARSDWWGAAAHAKSLKLT